MNPVVLLAEGADANVTAITTAISGMVTTVTSVITSVLPVVLPVGGIILAAFVGFKLFKKFAKG